MKGNLPTKKVLKFRVLATRGCCPSIYLKPALNPIQESAFYSRSRSYSKDIILRNFGKYNSAVLANVLLLPSATFFTTQNLESGV